ncbi:hypothetical protein Q7P36_011141 [Cladosporium allicinum]|jgi:hypothetical protein
MRGLQEDLQPYCKSCQVIYQHPRHADKPFNHNKNVECKSCRIIIDREEQKEIDAERKADEDAAKAVKDANSFWNVPAKTRKDERDDDSKGGKSYKGKGKGRAR